MNYFLEIHWSKISKEQSIFSNSNSDNFFISGPLWLNQSEREWRNDKLNVIFIQTQVWNLSFGKISPKRIANANKPLIFDARGSSPSSAGRAVARNSKVHLDDPQAIDI